MENNDYLQQRAEQAESRLASLFEQTRERCAKLAEDWGYSNKPDFALGIAKAIRELEDK